MRIVLMSNGRNHWYKDLDTGRRVPGVTTEIGDGMPKKALINWSAESTAAHAVDNWDDLSKLGPAARLKELSGARWKVRDEAANRGTEVHKIGQRLIEGERVTVPPALAGYVESYCRFIDEFQLREVYIEAVVYSEMHYYCGRLDIIADLLFPDMPEYDHLLRDDDGFVRCLVDAKTNKSGIFGETALQLAAYRYAERMLLDPKQLGDDVPYRPAEQGRVEIDMPAVAWTGAVHIRPDGYSLVPVVAGPDQHRSFLYVAQVGEFDRTSRDLVGVPIQPPTASRYRLVEWTADAES